MRCPVWIHHFSLTCECVWRGGGLGWRRVWEWAVRGGGDTNGMVMACYKLLWTTWIQGDQIRKPPQVVAHIHVIVHCSWVEFSHISIKIVEFFVHFTLYENCYTDKIDGNRISLVCEFSASDARKQWRFRAAAAATTKNWCDFNGTPQSIEKIHRLFVLHHHHHGKSSFFGTSDSWSSSHSSAHTVCCVMCARAGCEWAHCRSSMSSMFFISFLHISCTLTLFPYLLQTHTHTHILALSLSLSSRVYFPFVIRWCVAVLIVAIVVVLTAVFVSLSLFSLSLCHCLSFLLCFHSFHADFCITRWIQLLPHHCSRCQWIVTSRLLHDYQEIFSYTNVAPSNAATAPRSNTWKCAKIDEEHCHTDFIVHTQTKWKWKENKRAKEESGKIKPKAMCVRTFTTSHSST